MSAGTDPKGLPLGIQLAGPRFRDEAWFDAAAWVRRRFQSGCLVERTPSSAIGRDARAYGCRLATRTAV